MARFCVYEHKETGNLVLDIQANLLNNLNTRVVVPLLPVDEAPTGADRLNPVFNIEGEQYVMVTQFLSAVRNAEIGPEITNLYKQDTEIQNALDMLFSGF